MSTRCTTHFIYGSDKKPTAIIYRHSDGYPEGAGRDLLAFLKECQQLRDPRLSDPSYLAAKYVVFLADMFNHHYDWKAKEPIQVRNDSKLDFLSVGIVQDDPGDIEFRYIVNCGKFDADKLPAVECYSVHQDYKSGNWTEQIVEIPVTEPL